MIEDYITPIKQVLKQNSNRETCKKELTTLLSGTKHILRNHMEKGDVRVEAAVDYLLQPDTQRRLHRFNIRDWTNCERTVFRTMKKVLGTVPEPDIVLYPGMRRSNGKLIHLGKRSAISLSPDFGYCSGDNLYLLIAHEYVHYLRAVMANARFHNQPIYKYIFEEGFAVYLSAQVMPDRPLSTIFMSSLHHVIGMKDPAGGYVRWCTKNLPMIASVALEALGTKSRDHARWLFECDRLKGENTPIRTGYFLGFKMIESALQELSLKNLLTFKPTARKVRKWVESLADSS
jgi:hypothetical protein